MGVLLEGSATALTQYALAYRLRWSTGMIMEITYGHRIQSMEDQYVKLAHEATEATVLAGSPGSMLVDFFPVREYFPPPLPPLSFSRPRRASPLPPPAA